MDKIFFLELLATQAAHWNVSRQGFEKLGISEGIPKILYILQMNEGCVQKHLAKLCQIKESTLTVLLKRMESMAFIRKEKMINAGGKRAFGIYLTETGREKAKEVRHLVEEIDKKSLEGFSDEESSMFYSFMERVRKNLEKFC